MRVNEIFYSMSGEVGTSVPQGAPTVFIRLNGCNLRCPYCDTRKTWTPEATGEVMSPVSVATLAFNRGYQGRVNNYLFTGGEPLLQEQDIIEVMKCLRGLTGRFPRFQVETNGTLMPCPDIIPMATFVYDYKLDRHMATDGGPVALPVWQFMKMEDWLKIPITGEDQLPTAKEIIVTATTTFHLPHVAVSPVSPGMTASRLIEWLRDEDLCRVLVNIQLHKYVGVA